MYEVFLERGAERELERLPDADFRRLIVAIRALGEDPRPAGCRKIVGSAGDWRIRVGSYRIVYEIDDEARVVRAMRVCHRREAYP